MKKICLLHKLREKVYAYHNHQAIFIIAGGIVQGDILYQAEYPEKRMRTDDGISPFFHMASVTQSLIDNVSHNFNKGFMPYAPEITEEDAIILENVTLKIGNTTTKLDSMLLFTDEIIGMSVVYNK